LRPGERGSGRDTRFLSIQKSKWRGADEGRQGEALSAPASNKASRKTGFFDSEEKSVRTRTSGGKAPTDPRPDPTT